jgi:cell wall-associated NlpC family hydrolase
MIISFLVLSCTNAGNKPMTTDKKHNLTSDTVYRTNSRYVDSPNTFIDSSNALYIQPGNATPEQVVSFAETLLGVPYKYASTDPKQGFDCSGFITYVFNHFNIDVPRSSVDFTNVPHEISVEETKPGDLILFTGTDSTIRIVGHMGIVIYNGKNELLFIHSSSGKANGVTITPLNDYYKGRFVKVIRIFPQNDTK